MEEILASIRRIIADDQSLPGRMRPDVDAPPPEEPPSSVHVLRTDEVEKPMAEMASDGENGTMQGLIAAPQFVGPEGPIPDAPPVRRQEPTAPDPLDEAAGDVGRDATRAEHDLAPGSTVPSSGPPAATLLSTATNNAVSSAFNVLAASRLADNSAELLGMTREMVRPLLRAWLDDNLPALVERLVRDEIERVARGGR